jgi:uncharacterized protein with ATP-grasp and redox domains
MGRIIHSIIKEQAHNDDPYEEIKCKSNEIALAVYPHLKSMVRKAKDCLLKAVKVAIAGNIIDYGAVFNLDINKEIETILRYEEDNIRNGDKYFIYKDFVKHLDKTRTLLYLADNAGEIVFDRILIEEIKAAYPGMRIYFAVRGQPIINDCTIKDAITAGIDKITTLITSGSDAPGTILSCCSPQFLHIWQQSDLIISKGQGNFESLSGAQGNIFFMFIVKCQPLAREMGWDLRNVILCRNRN